MIEKVLKLFLINYLKFERCCEIYDMLHLIAGNKSGLSLSPLDHLDPQRQLLAPDFPVLGKCLIFVVVDYRPSKTLYSTKGFNLQRDARYRCHRGKFRSIS